MTGPPPQPADVALSPDAGQLQAMNQSAAQSTSPVQNGVQDCPKTSWFSIRVVDDKDAVVEGLTLKLKLPELGEIERLTSKAQDPLKVEQLAAGGKCDVTSIDAGEHVWEASADIT